MSDIKKPKHLIYYDWHLDIRAGGPTGYLANLRYGLDRIKNPDDFCIDLWCQKKQNGAQKKKRFLRDIIENNKFLNYLYVNYFSKSKKKFYKNYLKILEDIDTVYVQDDVIEKIKKENIKMVHAHVIVDALKIINTLKRDNIQDVKVILTSHQPEAPANENYNLLIEQGFSKKKAIRFKRAWEYVQQKAFTKADILVFPSPEAMEPYFATIPEFGEWTKDKDVRFYQTGAKQLESSKTKEELRAFYGVPEDKNIVVYIGCHIEVKGYDILAEAGEKILNSRNDTVFLIGGKQNNLIPAPRHKNWKELGWINPADLLKIADVFVLPNRQTYFDLILLEVMSMGTPVIASNTGGNKSVQKQTKALIMYDASAEDLFEKLNAFLDLSKKEKSKISQKMLACYEKYYTPEHFAERYLELIEKIYKDYNLLENNK